MFITLGKHMGMRMWHHLFLDHIIMSSIILAWGTRVENASLNASYDFWDCMVVSSWTFRTPIWVKRRMDCHLMFFHNDRSIKSVFFYVKCMHHIFLSSPNQDTLYFLCPLKSFEWSCGIFNFLVILVKSIYMMINHFFVYCFSSPSYSM